MWENIALVNVGTPNDKFITTSTLIIEIWDFRRLSYYAW